nr:translation initiation factor 1 [Pueraria montana var. lobata]UZA65130.1 translation initiation factor 1 [Pueraria montana var. thomsonii]UZA65299.1 translation initiation factor 1 [Pueraria montana]
MFPKRFDVLFMGIR